MIAALTAPQLASTADAGDIAASLPSTSSTTTATCATCRCSSNDEAERRQMWTQFAAAALGALVQVNDRAFRERGHASGYDEVAREATFYAGAMQELLDEGSEK